MAIGYLDREIDPADDVADAIVYEELRPVVLAALSRIRSGDRDVLLMSALGGLSMVEVGEALGVPVGTVKSRLSRARSQLKVLLPAGIREVLEDDS